MGPDPVFSVMLMGLQYIYGYSLYEIEVATIAIDEATILDIRATI